ncbi:hypothetical protein PRIPAC_86533 [Pristionchus pacificus]|uniref:Uncharacterized protein n=1 Tax=Pristionchus pacificus TaxID=54126 RepID=A0A2A6BK72_PRIPA|nr:hypothetical protein PRIPAC_86533 [Pristionchus pacificus]|eukprot:PDM66299.1 hypothetical protein PRIPAC_47716 [Pristionchus pacificus]
MTAMNTDENQLKDVHFKLIEYIVMGSLFIFGGSMIATGLIFIFLRDKSSRLKFEKRVNARLKKLGVEPAVRKMIRETEKDALTRSQTESPNQSNTSLISLQ